MAWRMIRPPDRATLFAPHRRGGRFFNPWGGERRSFLEALRWQLRRAPGRTRRAREVARAAADPERLRRRAARAELTWIGHASFALHEGETVALLDPHFGPRALLPPRQTAPGLPLDAVPERGLVLVSHNHYDHLDAWTLARLPKGLAVRVPLGLEGYVRSFGFADVAALDWWQECEVAGWRLTFVPMQHWSNRIGQRPSSTLWGGWVIDTGATRVLFAGDSGYFHGFAEIGRQFDRLDAALLPVGAYEPRWFMRPVHMNPAEALDAFADTGARTLVPTHWGTFDLADEAVDEPPRELARRLAEPRYAGLAPRVRVLAVGETLEL
jgi:L-ascorbate metabolism protein UlaG (beta-lactamase superfamily)